MTVVMRSPCKKSQDGLMWIVKKRPSKCFMLFAEDKIVTIDVCSAIFDLTEKTHQTSHCLFQKQHRFHSEHQSLLGI